MTADLPVVVDGELDAALVRNSEERHVTGDRIERPDLNFLARTHTDLAETPVTQMIGCGANLRGCRSSGRSRSGGCRSSTAT